MVDLHVIMDSRRANHNPVGRFSAHFIEFNRSSCSTCVVCTGQFLSELCHVNCVAFGIFTLGKEMSVSGPDTVDRNRGKRGGCGCVGQDRLGGFRKRLPEK